jgi:hypothetical protein
MANKYRDQKTKEAFIKYLQKETDERFFQALTNFTGMPYIGVAATPAGDNFKDLWHTEADRVLELGNE